MNVKSPYRVQVILDAAFGKRLAALPTDEPVWIVASPENKAAAREFCRSTKSHLDGISLFQSYGCGCEEAFLGVLDAVDLHHGEHSAKPPYSLIEVIGCPPSEEIRSALAELDFRISAVTPEGFSAQRSTHGAITLPSGPSDDEGLLASKLVRQERLDSFYDGGESTVAPR